jgi:DNA-binding MarR family transcriptional regulator
VSRGALARSAARATVVPVARVPHSPKRRGAGPKRALAAAAWRVLFDFLRRTRPQRDAVLGEHDLTPNDARALASIDVPGGRTMTELAVMWGADPSSVTFAIGRLEARGLVARRVARDDRRIKRATLTARGRRLRDALTIAFDEPPPELHDLDARDLRALVRIGRKIARVDHAPSTGPRRAGPST